MGKIGKFRGFPVYEMDQREWSGANTKKDDCIYVVSNVVYFHDQKIAKIMGGTLFDFDEMRFNALKNLWEEKDNVVTQLNNTRSAETEPTSEESLDKENTEPTAAEDIVEEFMNNWLSNIERELEILHQKGLEYEVC